VKLEAESQKRTENTMAKRKKDKTLHIKLMIGQHEPQNKSGINSGAPEFQVVTHQYQLLSLQIRVITKLPNSEQYKIINSDSPHFHHDQLIDRLPSPLCMLQLTD
jgi:hypothetical protein